MGRDAKPHRDVHIKMDSSRFDFMESMRVKVGMDRTEFIEEAVYTYGVYIEEQMGKDKTLLRKKRNNERG